MQRRKKNQYNVEFESPFMTLFDCFDGVEDYFQALVKMTWST